MLVALELLTFEACELSRSECLKVIELNMLFSLAKDATAEEIINKH